jgi:hypothetical protein
LITTTKPAATQLSMFDFPGETIAPPSEADLAKRLREYQKQSLVQVAPNVWRYTGDGQPPELVICRVVPNADGTLRLVPAYEKWMRLCRRNVSALGMEGQYHTLRRLGRADFIEILNPAPGYHFLNLCSWWGHLARVAEDPEFWSKDTAEGRKRFQTYKRNMF